MSFGYFIVFTFPQFDTVYKSSMGEACLERFREELLKLEKEAIALLYNSKIGEDCVKCFIDEVLKLRRML